MRKANKASKPATVANVSNVAPVSAPAATAKPAKPAKPDAAAERVKREALTTAARATVSKLYSGPSLAVHAAKPGKLAVYIARIQTPRQATDAATVRDESLLSLLAANADKAGHFDPSAPSIAADLGVISRLASLGFIASDGKLCTITATGAERARLVAKRA